MLTVKTVQEIRDIIAADDAATYKEGVRYEVMVPGEYEPDLHTYMYLQGWRDMVNYIFEEVKEKGQPTGEWSFLMFAHDREFLEVILASAEKLVSIATEHGRARLRETMGD